eukprot:7898606-Prorocentrum_lima.AAC.1
MAKCLSQEQQRCTASTAAQHLGSGKMGCGWHGRCGPQRVEPSKLAAKRGGTPASRAPSLWPVPINDPSRCAVASAQGVAVRRSCSRAD